MAKKREQQMTRKEFVEAARQAAGAINGLPFGIMPRIFSTGSVGWHASQKMNMQVGEKLVECQLGLTLTVVGSKDWPMEER